MAGESREGKRREEDETKITKKKQNNENRKETNTIRNVKEERQLQ